MRAPWLLPVGLAAVAVAARALLRYVRSHRQALADEAEEFAIERYELELRGYTYHWVALGRFLRGLSVGSAAVIAAVSVGVVYLAGVPVVTTNAPHPGVAAPTPAAQPVADAATPGPQAAPPGPPSAGAGIPAPEHAAPLAATPKPAASARPRLPAHTAVPAVASAGRTASPSPSATPSPSVSPSPPAPAPAASPTPPVGPATDSVAAHT